MPARRPVRLRIGTAKRISQDQENQQISQCEPPSFDEALKENLPPSFDTPTAPRFKDAFASVLPLTPRHRVRLGGKLITPRSHRSADQSRTTSIYTAARQLFSQSGTTGQIIGRQQEREELQTFISEGLVTKKGGCLYVSGPPGTGKSALVQEVLQQYRSDGRMKVSIVNCVTSRTTSEVISQLSQDLAISVGSSKDLSKMFTTRQTKAVHLVLMDEIDSLLDADCELLYNMFEWALHRTSSLLLIGIANALDLTDRFMPRLKSRNLKPQLLPFMPYTAQNMSDIISLKLRTLLPTNSTETNDFTPVIHPTAIKLIGSKIAAQTGDLRKAFSLARRSIDQIEKETMEAESSAASTPTKTPLTEISNGIPTPSKSSPLKDTSGSRPVLTAEAAPRASIKHVARLAASIFNQGTISRLSSLNLQQKAVLCSLVSAERRQNSRDPFKTPSKSAKKIPDVRELYEKYGRLCQSGDGLLPVLKNTEFRDVVASLETLGLMHEATGRGSSMLTPSKTPAKTGRNIDERRYVSAVSESEMRENLNGPGADLLQRLMEE